LGGREGGKEDEEEPSEAHDPHGVQEGVLEAVAARRERKDRGEGKRREGR
jgi:hypothetical protein